MIYFYSIEITFRFIYIFISFILCGIISIYNVNWLFLVLTYPFLKLFNKKFIITQVTDLFNVTWILTNSISFLFILPLTFWQLLNFFKPSWYTYQIDILKVAFQYAFIVLGAAAVLCYATFLPSILNFLIYWEKIEQNSSILTIDTEFRILNFICWVLNFQYSFAFLILLYLVVISLLWILMKFIKVYFLIKLYRKQLSFFSLVLLFFLLPPDIFLQFFLIFFINIFYEAVFFFVCYKVSNSN
uniref:Sec-independent protein translocase component TatC n=1 Tax=Grateloupia turuturu TaxID=118375 RepID=UPI00279DF01F|nr:Sec-independent protein translocase component TatC [Grateloupia turuturu]YP_010986438.1 SecY-independent protein translocase component TatC [Pachymeniopsis lanceolata]WIM51246.1 Sec-independent protein translocase component TatC [Grateloupia turuturu]WOL37406.1 SecY-independent protein translocase component TatC [Pachymeniopsis lanceolata]